MGRFTQLLTLSSLSLVAGVALGQTGLIVEPWRKLPAAPAVATQPMPSSGLPPAVGSPRKPQPPMAEAVPATPVARKWSPPIVELLVDPWGKSPVAAPTTPRAWVPTTVEIIDPWAGSQPVPRLASRRARPPTSTIF